MGPPSGICIPPLFVHADLDELSVVAAERWIALSQAAIAQRGLFHAALSGGTTPKRLYQLLAHPEYRARVDWSRTRLYFGDERAVPPSHADSNFRMVADALLGQVPLDPDQVQRMEADPVNIRSDAQRYADRLRALLPQDADDMPIFDLILLGMGADGHTCSLFPGTPILYERSSPVGSVYVEHLQSWRLSLTFPVLDAARQLLFLVAGSDKAAMLRRICCAAQPGAPVPVERIRPRGAVEWHLDRAAAAELDSLGEVVGE